ncbi:hypothetical protein GCM10027431_10000 [Lysobacter rhizosphaerae]
MPARRLQVTARGAFLGLCLILGLGCVPRAEHDQDAIPIEFDPAVWSQAERIVWPGTDRHVMVAYNHKPDDELCQKPLKDSFRDSLNKRRFVSGTACGQFWVVMPPYPELAKLTRMGWRGLAAHEAFHSAVQLSGTRKVPFAIATAADADWADADLKQANRFFWEVVAATRPPQTLDPAETCSRLSEAYGALGERELRYVRYKAHAEWPAEFFMRNYDAGLVNDQAYESYRRQKLAFVEDDVLYLAGGFSMQLVDRKLGRQAWQKRYIEGETPLNLLFEALGCEKPDPGQDAFPATVTITQSPLTVN